MDGMQIILLIMGAMIFIVSFLLPGGKGSKTASGDAAAITEDQIKFMVEKEIDDAKHHINDIIDETITYAMEKTERSMDRVTNEKMLAINEYSDTVLNEINKNQQEVVFLYDMLNDKHETLKSTVSQATITASEVKQTVRDAEVTAKEAEEAVRAVRDQLLSPFPGEGTEGFRSERAESVPPEQMGNSQPLRGDIPLSGRPESGQPDWVEIFRPERIEKVPPERIKSIPPKQMGNTPLEQRGNKLPEQMGNILPEQMGTEKMRNMPQQMESSQSVLGMDVAADDREMATSPFSQSTEKKQSRTLRKAKPSPAIAGETAETRITDHLPRQMEILFKGNSSGGRNNNERILELHKAGKSNMAIAKDLGLGLGEVKLVIDLFEGTN